MYEELLKLETKTKNKNIRLARDRYSTIWGGASLLRMLLASMTELLNKTEWKWDFIINLSESDYLVKTKESLVNFLSANRDKNFVKSHGREVQRFIQKQGLDKSFVECDTHMWRIGDRELPHGIQIDGGSDWVGLSRSFVRYITSIDHKPNELLIGLLRIFNHTLLPAESFFHTVLRNSQFCHTYVDNNLHVTNWKRRLGCKCQYRHVVDWCGCSPNDFKSEDWPRLLATEHKQLFFARKFEPIVNQAVITLLEEWLLGPYPSDYVNLHSYWQSVYHARDKGPKSDESLITVASSLACHHININYTVKGIVEITTYMDHDQYKGFVVRHEIVHVADHTDVIEMELLARPQQFGKVSRSSALGKRIKSIEVSTEYDQKEQMLRNFAKIMGPKAEPTFLLRLTEINADPTIFTARSYNLTVLWINPAGYLSDISDLHIDASSNGGAAAAGSAAAAAIQSISFAKSNLNPPLLPGIWTAKLVNKQSLIAQCNFLIVPKIRGEINASDIAPSNQATGKQHWDIFLPDAKDVAAMKAQALLNANLIDDDRIIWISDMIQKMFTIKDTCVVQRTNALPNVQLCSETKWSTYAPDPKSDLFATTNAASAGAVAVNDDNDDNDDDDDDGDRNDTN